MNLRLAMVGALAVGLLTALPAIAQGNFPDVPENHWAYEAIAKLKADGLFVGYPDGTFGGGRPASRYEFAAVAYRAYQKIKDLLQPLGDQIDELSRKIQQIQVPTEGPGQGEVSREDLEQLKSQIEALKDQLAPARDWQGDLVAIRKLMDKFGGDLDKLGTDQRAMSADLRALEERISALEKHKERVRIGGDVNVVGFAAHSIDGHIGVDWTGNPIGTDGSGNPVGVTRDVHFMNELALDLSGVYDKGVKMEVELLSSSLLGYEGSFSLVPGMFEFMTSDFQGHKVENNQDFLVHHAWADWDTTMLGTGMNVKIGRLGYASSNYFAFSRIDPDPYVDIPRWDDRKWYFDGAQMTFDFGRTDLALLGGKQTGTGTSSSFPVWPMEVGREVPFFDHSQRAGNQYDHLLDIQTHVGAELTMHLPRKSHVAAQYFILDGNTFEDEVSKQQFLDVNRARVLGTDAEIDLGGRLAFYGAAAKCDLFYNDHVFQSKDNEAYDLSLEWNRGGPTSVGGGYRYVAPFFGAPGAWDRLGYWYNPTDIKGWIVWAHHAFAKQTSLWASAQFLRGTDRLGAAQGGLSDADKIMSLNAYLRFPLCKGWKTVVGWEGLYWDMPDAGVRGRPVGKVNENYYTAEFTHDLGKAVRFRIGYQVSDYNNKTGDAFFNSPLNSFSQAKGGLLFTQFSVGF